MVENYIKDNNLEYKIQLIKNNQRKGALENLYNTIHKCRASDIIVTVDGDDWLAHNNVLSKLNKVYSNKNIWLTYGQFIYYPSNYIGCCNVFSKYVIDYNLFRKFEWVSSHLRTFYAALFQKIKKTDLQYENKFYLMAGDAAFMFPMLEMEKYNHFTFIPEILYIYNTLTPLSDNKVNKDLQTKLYNHLITKKSYLPLIYLN